MQSQGTHKSGLVSFQPPETLVALNCPPFLAARCRPGAGMFTVSLESTINSHPHWFDSRWLQQGRDWMRRGRGAVRRRMGTSAFIERIPPLRQISTRARAKPACTSCTSPVAIYAQIFPQTSVDLRRHEWMVSPIPPFSRGQAYTLYLTHIDRHRVKQRRGHVNFAQSAR